MITFFSLILICTGFYIGIRSRVFSLVKFAKIGRKLDYNKLALVILVISAISFLIYATRLVGFQPH